MLAKTPTSGLSLLTGIVVALLPRLQVPMRFIVQCVQVLGVP